MAVLNKKRRITKRQAQLIFCAIMYTLLALFIVILFVFNSNYAKIYNSSEVNNGKADFEGIDIPSRNVACNLAGKWEFFYNKWIVTDNYDGPCDGMIDVPGLWTYKNFGSGRLPKNGFASYRLTIENIQSDIDIIVLRNYSNLAYRVFINGQLNCSSGVISKDIDETKVTGSVEEQHPFHTDGTTLEIVIELSATTTGGFNAAPWLSSTATGKSYGSNLRNFNFIALGITTAVVAISILSFIFFKYKRNITAPAFMISLYIHFLFSREMLYVIPLQVRASMIVQLLSAIITFVILIIHCWRNGSRFKKTPTIASSIAATIITILLFVFYGTPIAPICAFALLGIGCCYFVPIVFNEKFATIQWGIYGILFMFLMSIFCFEMCDGLGLLVFGTEFIFTFELMVIIACFAVLWLWKVAEATRISIRVSELECELSSLKNQALKAQIKPHFIYNSLTAIQAQYRDGLNEGDKAIEQFAKHLRLLTDSAGKEIITFDEEIRNVLNYFELENLRANGKLNLLLDLNYTDFSVPVLSLQPLVENAIIHGGLRESKDGYIQVLSNKKNKYVIIKVIDNGKGFDRNSTQLGVGIENTNKRFELFNSKMEITSAPGHGTQVTIKIPLE
ncbi:MAG: histidine kinase [Clostridia bacterium]|nr:histidine kinase [Clostridia bacterium]